MPTAVGQASLVTIVELSGQQRTVQLGARALPYKGMKWSGAMRAEFTWYPGNPKASMQVLGPKLGPSTFHGMWKDRFISPTDEFGNAFAPQGILTLNGAQVASVMDANLLMNDIKNSGQQLRVTWDRIIRTGLLTEWDAAFTRAEDLEWDMTFEWDSEGQPDAVLGFASQALPADTLSKLNDKLDAIETYVQRFQQDVELAEDFGSKLNEAISNISTTIDSITGAAEQGLNLATAPAQSAQNILNGLERVQQQAQDIVDLVSGISGQYQAVAAQGASDVASFGYGSTLLTAQFALNVAHAAQDLRDTANTDADSFDFSNGQQDLIGVFEARQSADLRDVSTKFYGTPDQWQTLMLFNGMTDSALDSGDLVLVPRLRTSSDAQSIAGATS